MGTITLILKILTFPGSLTKAFLEQVACRLFNIPVEFSKYFQKNELCGHIEHLLAPKKGSFGVCFFPHIIMLILSLAFSIPSAMNLVYLGKVNWFGVLFFYLGISCLMNLFPLIEDATNMWEQLFGEESESKLIVKILLAVPAAIMYAGSYVEHYFASILTSLGFYYAIPYIVAIFIK